VPVSVRLALAAGFFALAKSVAVFEPAAGGAYRTVTAQDFTGPRAIAVQLSDVTENAVEPESMTFSVPVPEPPELVSVNVCDALAPRVRAP